MKKSIITEEEAQATLSAGLEKWENYIVPDGTYNSITMFSEAIIDKCWDIELYLRQELTETALAHYVPDKSKHGKRYGRNYINIFSHVRERGRFKEEEYHYDALDSVLHELAHHIHFMCYPNDKEFHGQKWRWICKIIGANPRATQGHYTWNYSKKYLDGITEKEVQIQHPDS